MLFLIPNYESDVALTNRFVVQHSQPGTIFEIQTHRQCVQPLYHSINKTCTFVYSQHEKFYPLQQ